MLAISVPLRPPDLRWTMFLILSYSGLSFGIPGHQYHLVENQKSWTEAQSYCREKYIDLATVYNEEYSKRLSEIMYSPGYAWIGLYCREVFSWKWSDGSNSSFRQWGPRQPTNTRDNQFCVTLQKNLPSWANVRCFRKQPFICYSAPETKVLRLELTPKDSSVDLHDPAALEAMLKQLNRKLAEEGVPGDVKLSWKKQSDGRVFHKEEEKKKEKKETRPKREL